MKLCFDATRFGGGLDGAILLAADRGLAAVEYCFDEFKVAATKDAAEVKGKEKTYLERVARLCLKHNVSIACLNLDYSHEPGDKASNKKFVGMLSKLLEVASILKCSRIGFFLSPGDDDSWKEKFEEEYAQLLPLFEEREVQLLLRVSTPLMNRGVSLKRWRAMEPQDWRDLISGCPGLSLSFSPGDCLWLGIDYLQILAALTPVIDHIEANDVEIHRSLLKDSGMFGPLWWRYRQIGKGQIDWGQFIDALKLYDYKGTFSIHLDDEFIATDDISMSDALDECLHKLKPFVRD
jgi:sugar phosphate isomerase/epimerase